MRIGLDTRFLHLGLTHSKRMNLLGGVAGYLYYLLPHLLATDSGNRYVLFADESRPIAPFQKFVQAFSNVELLSVASPFHVPLVDASLGAAVRLTQDRLQKLPKVRQARLDVLHTQEDVLGLDGVNTQEVVSIHSFLARRVVPNGIQGYVWRRKLDRLRQAGRLVAISHGLNQDIVDCLNLPPERVVTIYHGYEPDLFHVIDCKSRVAETLADYGIHSEYLLYVGGLAPEKNVPNLLRSYQIAKAEYGLDLPLVMCGLTPQFYKREFIRVRMLIRHLGIQDKVQILHYVPHRDLPAFYNGAKAVLSPSLSEGFGFAPLEAMACGVPVVVSTRPAMPEIAGDAGYYVDPEDTDQMAQGIYNVVHDSELSARMSERGLERARAFSWEKCAQETSKLYRNVSHAH